MQNDLHGHPGQVQGHQRAVELGHDPRSGADHCLRSRAHAGEHEQRGPGPGYSSGSARTLPWQCQASCHSEHRHCMPLSVFYEKQQKTNISRVKLIVVQPYVTSPESATWDIIPTDPSLSGSPSALFTEWATCKMLFSCPEPQKKRLTLCSFYGSQIFWCTHKRRNWRM